MGPQPALLLQPPAVPRGRWQAWASAFHWSGLWTSEGKGQRKGPSSSLKTQGGWCQESGASGAGGRIRVTPGVWVVLCRPFPSWRTTHLPLPWRRRAQLWSLGDSSRRGAWSCQHQEQGQGSPPPAAAGAAHPAAPPCFRSASARLPGHRAGPSVCRQSGLRARDGLRPTSPTVGVPVRGAECDARKRRGSGARPPAP